MPFGLYLPGRWRSQPQGPVEVDWGHPLARGLVCAVSDSFESVNRKRLTLDSRISRAPSPEGIGWYRATVLGNNPVLSAPTGTKIPLGSLFTVACVCRLEPGALNTAAALAFWGHDTRFWWNSSVQAFIFMLKSSTGTDTYAIDFGASRAAMERGTTVAGLWDGASMKVCRGGVVSAVASLSSISTSFNEEISIGNSPAYFAYHWVGWIPGLNAWSRALSDNELRGWHENPWQFYRPRRPIIYSLGSSGPFLSNATVIDIGTTTVRPSVTIQL